MSHPFPHSCGGCDARWTAVSFAHCAACHLTFSGYAAFDEHRVDGVCLKPEDTRLVLSDRFLRIPVYGYKPRREEPWWEERQGD